MISMIAAMDMNRVIGKDNKLPWRLPADLAYFKKLTLGHRIIIGRKTHESIGKPLPGRESWVLTRDRNYESEGCKIVHSIEEVMAAAGDEEVFVIGGDTVYSAFFPVAEKLYITFIEDAFEGDTYFPEIDLKVWKLVEKTKGIRDEKNPYNYYYQIYEKIIYEKI